MGKGIWRAALAAVLAVALCLGPPAAVAAGEEEKAPAEEKVPKEPESPPDAVRELEQELRGLIEDLKGIEKSAREKLQKEVIPQVREEIRKLREELDEQLREWDREWDREKEKSGEDPPETRNI